MDYKAILASEERVRGIIRDELNDLLRHHGNPRRTLITPAESEVDMEDLIPNEQVIITISTDDYVKRMHIDTFREQRRGGQVVCDRTGRDLTLETLSRALNERLKDYFDEDQFLKTGRNKPLPFSPSELIKLIASVPARKKV